MVRCENVFENVEKSEGMISFERLGLTGLRTLMFHYDAVNSELGR
jgi:hypothetical protein